MNNLMKKISATMDNPLEIINSKKGSKVLQKAAVTLAMTAAVLSPISQAYAHADSAPHVHFEYAQIMGESELVRDHIQNVQDFAGVSIDQGSDYLNYKHPLHSKLNDYIKHAKENYSESDFNRIENLAEKAQEHYNNGHYEKIDEYAHNLMPLIDNSPIFFIDTTSGVGETQPEHVVDNVKSVVDLFNEMHNDKSFDFNYQEFFIPSSDMDFHRVAVRNLSDEEGYIISYQSEEGSSYASNAHLAAWFTDGMSRESDLFQKYAYNELEILKEPYSLTDFDVDRLQNLGKPHEMGHIAAPDKYYVDKVEDGSKRELVAEIMSTWNDVKSGASEGYLEFRKDANISIIGLVNKSQGAHDGYGLLKSFYDRYSHAEVKAMDLDEIRTEMVNFIDSVPEDVYTFGEIAHKTASQEIEKNGIFPKAQDYFAKTGKQQDVMEMLAEAKKIPNADIISSFLEQNDILTNPNSSFFEKFAAKHFPEEIISLEKKTGYADYAVGEDYISQLVTHLSSKNEGDFEFNYGAVKNGFDGADTFVQLTDNFKIDKQGNILTKSENGVLTNVSQMYNEVMVDIKDSEMILNVMDEDYNDLDIKITAQGELSISINGGTERELKSSDFNNLDENLEFKEQFQSALVALENKDTKQEMLASMDNNKKSILEGLSADSAPNKPSEIESPKDKSKRLSM